MFHENIPDFSIKKHSPFFSGEGPLEELSTPFPPFYPSRFRDFSTHFLADLTAAAFPSFL